MAAIERQYRPASDRRQRGQSGNQAFDFIGTDKFTGHAGGLRYEKAGSDTYVYGDSDGDKKIDSLSSR